MKIFKIRDTATGLFSMGGHSPRWTKKGKAWTNIGHVKNHINNLSRHVIKNVDHWEVVEYELVETTVGSVSVQTIVEENLRKEREKELEQQQRLANQQALKARAISKLSKEEREALRI
jgi:hypothetical protein